MSGIFFLSYILNRDNISRNYSPETTGPLTSKASTLSLELEQPIDGTFTNQSSATVSGRTAPNTTVIIVNNQDTKVINSQPDGSFSTVVHLDEGVNNITVAIFNPIGDQKQIDVQVFYAKEKI